MILVKYKVLREHIGPDGQLFSPHGEFNTRWANSNEVAHLVPQTLEEIDLEAEAAAKAAAEAEAAAKAAAEAEAAKAPENKAAKPAKEVKEG